MEAVAKAFEGGGRGIHCEVRGERESGKGCSFAGASFCGWLGRNGGYDPVGRRLLGPLVVAASSAFRDWSR